MSCQTERTTTRGSTSSAIVMPMLRRIERDCRPLNGDAGEFVADVGDLDVVHDDEFVEDVFQALGLPELGIDEQVVAEVVDIEIALDAALRIQDEVVIAVVLREVAHIVGDHAVSPADTVGAGEHDLRAPAEVVHASGEDEGMIFRPRIAKGACGLGTAVLGEVGASGSQLVIEWSACHKTTDDYILREIREHGRGEAS